MMFLMTFALFFIGFQMDTQLLEVPRSMPSTRPAKTVSVCVLGLVLSPSLSFALLIVLSLLEIVELLERGRGFVDQTSFVSVIAGCIMHCFYIYSSNRPGYIKDRLQLLLLPSTLCRPCLEKTFCFENGCRSEHRERKMTRTGTDSK